jgi:amino acid adenylation domain-containing protein
MTILEISGLTDRNGVTPMTVHETIDAWADATPDAVAVADPAGDLTYSQLVARAGELAAALRAVGVGPEGRVGVVCERGASFVVMALAALKAGGAYVPLDPSYPAEVLGRLTRAARLDALVAPDGRVAFDLPDDTPVLPPDGHVGDWPQAGTRSGSLMYLIFTSGSTGEPKSVAVTHADVLALARDDARLAVTAGDRVAHLAPVAFDASVFEIWVTLVSGATVSTVPPGPLSVAALGEYLRTTCPDWLFLTTGLFHAMVDHDLNGLSHARRILTGGDILSPQHVWRAASRTQVYAAYGPTETTVFASLHAIDAAAQENTVPLGTPLAGSGMAVLGSDLRPLPDGSIGEIHITGAGVARGYDGSPSRTALRFVPDRGTHGGRMYRTGDLGSQRPGGEFVFHGRADRQVKVRGFRVELGEIETVLNQHPHVAAGAALAVPAPGGKRLVGYVAPVPGQTLSPADVRAWLADRLPAHLVPGTVSVLKEMPLDRNAKFDRGALPDPWVSRESFDVQDFVVPKTHAQARIAEVFADVLGVDRVGADDDFFVLGGDSLRSVDLLATLAESGIHLSPREFFRGPTVAEIARLVTGRQPEPGVLQKAG